MNALNGKSQGDPGHLKWKHVDFENNVITITNQHEDGFHVKDWETRHIPMEIRLRVVLLTQKDLSGHCPHVFPTRDGQIRTNNLLTNLKRTARKAGIPDWKALNVIALRHTFASHKVMQGVDLRTVQALMGHANFSMTLRYAHLAKDHIMRSVESDTY